MEDVQNYVLDVKLADWKRGQSLSNNGVIPSENFGAEISLEKIKKWCEQLAQIIWQCRPEFEKVKFFKFIFLENSENLAIFKKNKRICQFSGILEKIHNF